MDHFIEVGGAYVAAFLWIARVRDIPFMRLLKYRSHEMIENISWHLIWTARNLNHIGKGWTPMTAKKSPKDYVKSTPEQRHRAARELGSKGGIAKAQAKKNRNRKMHEGKKKGR